MENISEKAKKIKQSPFVIFSALADSFNDCIKMNSGSPGHGMDLDVYRDLCRVKITGASSYRSHPYGTVIAREHACAYYQQRYSIKFDTSQVNVSTGFTHAFKTVCESLLDQGDEVILTDPVFPQYIQPIKLQGASIFKVPTFEKNEWEPTFEDINKVLSKHQHAKLLVLNYPNNPTGASLEEAGWDVILEAIKEDLRRRQKIGLEPLTIVLDDAYAPLNHKFPLGRQPTFGYTLRNRIVNSLIDQKNDVELLSRILDNSVIICSLSKEGLAGVLTGIAASKNRSLIKAMRTCSKTSVISVSIFSETALESIVKHDVSATISWAVRVYQNRLEKLSSGLNSIFKGIKGLEEAPVTFVPNAGMYLYANFSALRGLIVPEKIIQKISEQSLSGLDISSPFKHGQLNTNLDIALWLVFSAGVVAVPVDPQNLYLRFSVGLPQALVDNDGEIDRDATEIQGMQIITDVLELIEKSIRQILLYQKEVHSRPLPWQLITSTSNNKEDGVIEIKQETKEALARHLLQLAYDGHDVQNFLCLKNYKGTKKSLLDQQGYYNSFEISKILKLSMSVVKLLQQYKEDQLLNYFQFCRQACLSPHSSKQENSSYVQKLSLIPSDFFEEIGTSDFIAPNGLRIPDDLKDLESIRGYSAKLLVPKLLLTAIVGILDQVPWLDPDMDLNSAVHAMRPDLDKYRIESGYGGGKLLPHTDGYWNELMNVPKLTTCFCISNPFSEPTYFIPVELIFRIPCLKHPQYNSWLSIFEDLIFDEFTPQKFVLWAISEALKPQFNFRMGVIGGDAKRQIQNVPLLEFDSVSEAYLFRYKSTFDAYCEEANVVVEFVKRMITFNASYCCTGKLKQALKPGEMYIASNGTGLRIDLPEVYEYKELTYRDDGYAYAVSGLATIHGRSKLSGEAGTIDRTLVRCNTVHPEHSDVNLAESILMREELNMLLFGKTSTIKQENLIFQEKGPVYQLLRSGYRGNHLKR